MKCEQFKQNGIHGSYKLTLPMIATLKLPLKKFPFYTTINGFCVTVFQEKYIVLIYNFL